MPRNKTIRTGGYLQSLCRAFDYSGGLLGGTHNDGRCLKAMSAPYTILFVEDDEGVRESTAAILASSGFRLLVAQSGEEALQLLDQGHVDVLFTDVVMPGLNGIELAKRAKRLRPDLKIMFMTAYYSRAAEAKEVGKLLFKPVRDAEILAGLAELLPPN
jgi:two-component system, cell cycle response regulator CpdR